MNEVPFIASEFAEVRYRGQMYERLRIEPFERKDGSASSVAIWRSTCAQCEEPFECTSPAIVPRFRPARRCEDCRKKCKWGDRFKKSDPALMGPLPDGRPIAPLAAYEGEIGK